MNQQSNTNLNGIKPTDIIEASEKLSREWLEKGSEPIQKKITELDDQNKTGSKGRTNKDAASVKKTASLKFSYSYSNNFF